MDLGLEWHEWAGLALGVLGLYGLVQLDWVRQRFRTLDRLIHRTFPGSARDKAFRTAWSDTLDDLNGLVAGSAALYRLSFDGPPGLSRQAQTDCAVLTQILSTRISARAAKIRADPRVNNKPHGFADARDVRAGGAAIRFVPGDYAMVRAAREAGLRPPALSGNAIVFCQATKQVLLQLRGSTATYPNCLHVFGGNYEPAVDLAEHDDHLPGPGLRNAALREVKEECGLVITDLANCLVFVGEELTTGFVRSTYAGLSVPASERGKVRAPAEGRVEWFSFDELADYARTGRLAGQDWRITPSGAVELMAWLRLGAPDQYRETPNREAALRLYTELAAHAAERIAQTP